VHFFFLLQFAAAAVGARSRQLGYTQQNGTKQRKAKGGSYFGRGRKRNQIKNKVEKEYKTNQVSIPREKEKAVCSSRSLLPLLLYTVLERRITTAP